MNIQQHLKKFTNSFNKYIAKFISGNEMKTPLYKAMKYGLLNGGKRIRPYIICEFSKMIKIPKKSYQRLALAVELVHSYSLIHDDLPAMDNDDFRRGKLTTHKKYDEGTAILAGNSLLVLAFKILSDSKTHQNAKVRSNLVEQLALASGHLGLAGGQSDDIIHAGKKISKNHLRDIHINKTARLFEFCLLSPLLLSNNFTIKLQNEARKFGLNLGLIFQATDDLIDYGESSSERDSSFCNIRRFMSEAEIRDYCVSLADNCTHNSKLFGSNDNPLNKLIYNLASRTS